MISLLECGRYQVQSDLQNGRIVLVWQYPFLEMRRAFMLMVRNIYIYIYIQNTQGNLLFFQQTPNLYMFTHNQIRGKTICIFLIWAIDLQESSQSCFHQSGFRITRGSSNDTVYIAVECFHVYLYMLIRPIFPRWFFVFCFYLFFLFVSFVIFSFSLVYQKFIPLGCAFYINIYFRVRFH